MLLNTLQCTGRSPQQRLIQPKISTVRRLGHSRLQNEGARDLMSVGDVRDSFAAAQSYLLVCIVVNGEQWF